MDRGLQTAEEDLTASTRSIWHTGGQGPEKFDAGVQSARGSDKHGDPGGDTATLTSKEEGRGVG